MQSYYCDCILQYDTETFLPLNSTVLFGRFRKQQNVLTEPLEKPMLNWGGYPNANYCIKNTNQYRLHPVSQKRSPVFFHAFYDIFENLIGFHHFYLKMGGFPTEKARKYGWSSCRHSYHRWYISCCMPVVHWQ